MLRAAGLAVALALLAGTAAMAAAAPVELTARFAPGATLGTSTVGGALVARLPAIPSLAGTATVSLTDMRLAIGSRAIVYRTRRGIRYRPEGVALPSRCPRHRFRFRAEVEFADRSSASAETAIRCPPPAAVM